MGLNPVARLGRQQTDDAVTEERMRAERRATRRSGGATGALDGTLAFAQTALERRTLEHGRISVWTGALPRGTRCLKFLSDTLSPKIRLPYSLRQWGGPLRRHRGIRGSQQGPSDSGLPGRLHRECAICVGGAWYWHSPMIEPWQTH